MIKNKLSLSQKGFTLVELLIVIVIIGILAGVVIGVLNPVQQQNRARDASVRAQLDKIALSAKSLYVSSPRNSNRSPTEAEFISGLSSVAASPATTCTATTDNSNDDCRFALNGITLPATCDTSLYMGAGTEQCQFMYYREPTLFRAAAKGAANPVSILVYTYTESVATGNVAEGFYSCQTTWTFGTDPATSALCTRLN